VSEPVVRVAGLTKVFRTYRRHEGLAAALKSLVRRVTTEVAAVADVTFSVEPGEMVGYIGANGAGKSTTIKMLTGILTPTSGEVVCNGFVPYRDRTATSRRSASSSARGPSSGGISRSSSRSSS
jgi:ABC-2 type transport system ATP-binding protein